MYLGFYRAHLHAAHLADLAFVRAGGEQLEGIQLLWRQCGEDVEHEEKAAFISLDPAEFAAYFVRDLRADGGLASVGGGDRVYDLLVGGIF